MSGEPEFVNASVQLPCERAIGKAASDVWQAVSIEKQTWSLDGWRRPAS